MDNKYKRLGFNTFFVFIGNVGPRLISFVLMPFYTFWLSKEDFGIQDIMSIYAVLIIPYVTLGLYEAIFVYPKGKNKILQSKYFTSVILVVSFLIVLCVLFLSFLPVSWSCVIFSDKLHDYIPLLAFMIAINSFQRILQSFTRGIDKMRVFSITGVVYALVMTLLALFLIPVLGLKGYWIALLTAEFISCLYVVVAIRAWTYITFNELNFSYIKELLAFSIPLIPNATMWWIINSINRPILISTVGLDGVGLFSIAGKFPSILSLLFGIFFSAFQISALEEFGKDSYSRFYNNVFRIVLFVQVCIMFLLMLLGQLIFDIMIDEKFHDAVYYLPILCLGVIISNIAAYVGVTFTVLKRTKVFLYSAILAACVALIANFLLIPSIGIMGACLSIVLSQLVMIIYRWFKSSPFVDFVNKPYLVILIVNIMAALLIYYLIENLLAKQLVVLTLFIVFIYLNKDVLNSLAIIMNKTLMKFINR